MRLLRFLSANGTVLCVREGNQIRDLGDRDPLKVVSTAVRSLGTYIVEAETK